MKDDYLAFTNNSYNLIQEIILIKKWAKVLNEHVTREDTEMYMSTWKGHRIASHQANAN